MKKGPHKLELQPTHIAQKLWKTYRQLLYLGILGVTLRIFTEPSQVPDVELFCTTARATYTHYGLDDGTRYLLAALFDSV